MLLRKLLSLRTFTALISLLTLSFQTLSDTNSAATGTSYLVVVDSAGGSLTGPNDQSLYLTLRNIRPYVTAFADRPIRKALRVTADAFFSSWSTEFASSAPNAVLSYRVNGKSQPENIVLTLSNPVFSSSRNTVSFNAVRIFQSPDLLSKPGYPPLKVAPVQTPRQFGPADLFIDSLRWGPPPLQWGTGCGIDVHCAP